MRLKVGDVVWPTAHVEMCPPEDLKLYSTPGFHGSSVGDLYERDRATVLERVNIKNLVWCKVKTEESHDVGWCLQSDLERVDSFYFKRREVATALLDPGETRKVRTRCVNFALRKFPDTPENALQPQDYFALRGPEVRDESLVLILHSLRVPFFRGRMTDVDCYVFVLEDDAKWAPRIGWIDAFYLRDPEAP